MPGPRLHELYNSKARQSTAGARKKGKLKRGSRSEAEEPADCNAAIITPKTKEEKEIERKEKLLQEVYLVFELCSKFYQLSSPQLASQSESKWTSKKKKRLEKYIVRLCPHLVLLSLFDKSYILRTKKLRRKNDL
jgi:ATP-dependent RNA helicase DHX37/DHR1